MQLDIRLIIGFAITIAMAMVHFGIQIYRTLKKQEPASVDCKTPNPDSKILIELTKTQEGIKHLDKTMGDYKEDNDRAHERIFNLINNMLLKKGG